LFHLRRTEEEFEVQEVLVLPDKARDVPAKSSTGSVMDSCPLCGWACGFGKLNWHSPGTGILICGHCALNIFEVNGEMMMRKEGLTVVFILTLMGLVTAALIQGGTARAAQQKCYQLNITIDKSFTLEDMNIRGTICEKP
jgi:hypothetical protein